MAFLQREFLLSNDTYKTKTSAGNTLHFIRGNEKTSRIPRKAKRFFRLGIFCFEYPRRRSGKGNFYFANYRFSFRKLQIFISQTTDSHFANYRFSFRKLQISISQTTDFHFVSSHFVSQTTVSLYIVYIISLLLVVFEEWQKGTQQNTVVGENAIRTRDIPRDCRRKLTLFAFQSQEGFGTI